MRHLQHHATLIVVLVPLALAACDTRGTLDSADLTPPLRPMAKQIWDPVIDPADFEDGSGNPNEINNSYFPLPIGRTWHYELETEDGTETTEVVVTNETKVILGVTTTVVRSQEFLDGTLIEDTDDWFAQDIDGNVWYFGEASVAYDNGIPSTEGSWEAGVDGALPGIIMLGDPAIGQQYNQEFAPDVAEDMGMVLFLDASVSVPAGDYTGCLKTMDWTPLEPGQREFKYYCPGTGLVLEVSPRDGGERNELVHVN